MAVSIESFLVLEDALSTRLFNAWNRDTASTRVAIIDAVNRGDFATAVDLCDGLAFGPSAERNRKFAEFVGMQAALFGASRLTGGDPKRTHFMAEGQPIEIKLATEVLMSGLDENATEAICRLAQTLLSQESADQQDETYKSERRRKEATTGFIRSFTKSVSNNGSASINLGSSLHNSRLGAWGFTQEATFRGIEFYQVNEQLDSRTCPVCTAMHGRKFAVGPADQKLRQWLTQRKPDQMKSLAPWPRQDRKSVNQMKGMSSSQLQGNGWDTPPYHPLCRGILVESGSIPLTIPTPPLRGALTGDKIRPDPIDFDMVLPDPHDLPFTGSVAEYRDRFFDPLASTERVMARHSDEARATIARFQVDLAKGKTTKQLHFNEGTQEWSAARQKVHARIIDDVLSEENILRATAAEGEQTLTILGGRGGSGKTFLTEGTDPDFFKKTGTGKGAPVDLSNKIVLNSDDLKARLPEYEGWNAFHLHEESSELLKRIEGIARDRNLNIVLDTTMQGVEKTARKVASYTAEGYEVEGYYMHLPREEAAFRAVFRSIKKDDPRYVPTEVILKNLDNEEAFDALKGSFTRWGVWDNQVPSGSLPRFVGGNNLARGTVTGG